MIINKMRLLILLFASLSIFGFSQEVAVKTNLLYGAYTYTPNLGLELALGRRATLDVGGGYNPWNLDGARDNNKKLVHWLGQIEYRYWFCQKFNGHFIGVHALGTEFNISQHELPLLFGKDSQKYRYQGYGYGGGISWGYQWILGKHWNLELNLGVGYARLHYDKFECKKCGNKIGTESRNYYGPTKAGVSLIYVF